MLLRATLEFSLALVLFREHRAALRPLRLFLGMTAGERVVARVPPRGSRGILSISCTRRPSGWMSITTYLGCRDSAVHIDGLNCLVANGSRGSHIGRGPHPYETLNDETRRFITMYVEASTCAEYSSEFSQSPTSTCPPN